MSTPVTSLTDAELREELLLLGFNAGPVTATTRIIYEKQLEKRRLGGGGAPTKTTDSPRVASKSPTRSSKKTTTTTTEVYNESVRASGDRRRTTGTSRYKFRSEPEDSSDNEDRGSEEHTKEDETHPVTAVTSRGDIAAPFSSPTKKPQFSPTKKPANTIYPGLLNTSAPIIYPAAPSKVPESSKVVPEVPKVTERILTPGRSTLLPEIPKVTERTSTPSRSTLYSSPIMPYSSSIMPSSTSYSTSSYIRPSPVTSYTVPSSTTPSSFSTPYGRPASVFSNITTDYINRVSPSVSPSRSYTGRIVGVEQQDEEDDEFEEEEEEDDDDGHTESSRIIAPSYISSAYTPARRKEASAFVSTFGYPSRIWRIITSPFKKTAKVSTYGQRPSYAMTQTRQESAVDISRFLLYSLTFLFGFLLVAYVLTAHGQTCTEIARFLANTTVETASFLYRYAILPTIMITIVVGAIAAAYFINQRWLAVQDEEKRKVFDLIEKITDIIRDANVDGQEYVAEPHVRDMIIPPSRRMRDSPEWKRWQEAVNFINQNESRVSTESRIINGVECAVWRWVPAKKTGWQGNAFEARTQLNVPEFALSRCLKLRGMFPSEKAVDKEGDVRRALLEKVSPIRPLHVHVDVGSQEGIVFARFSTLTDCRAAFGLLHGTWFNGQLVSAKYIRDERYEQRFPSAPRQ